MQIAIYNENLHITLETDAVRYRNDPDFATNVLKVPIDRPGKNLVTMAAQEFYLILG